jgi:hypothetical protein
MGRILKSYLFWTYPRGSVHYDVMVTLILAFLFLSPLVINYRERPQETLTSHRSVLVETVGANALIYDIGADLIGGGAQSGSGETVTAELQKRIEAISGKMQIDRYSAQKDASGRVTVYRVWAHR